jgi:hypothetical protein
VALAAARGLPPRLLRAIVVLLTGLGLGPAIYLALYLLMPMQAEDGTVRRGPRGLPLVADLVVMLPTAGVGLWWFVMLLANMPVVALTLGAIGALLLVVAGGAAHRARQARETFLLAELASRAGIADADELAAALEGQRERAPWALGATHARLPREARRDRGTGTRFTRRELARSAFVNIAVVLAVTAIAVVVVAQIDVRIVDKAAYVSLTFVAACALVLLVTGLRGRRAPGTIIAGCLALLLVLGPSAAVARVFADGEVNPYVITLDSWTPDGSASCPSTEWDSLGRTVVLDLSDLRVPDHEQAVSLWRQSMGVPDSVTDEALTSESAWGPPDLGMYVWCDRPIGDLRVILPKADIPVYDALTLGIGRRHGDVPTGFDGIATDSVPYVSLVGGSYVGSVYYEEGR